MAQQPAEALRVVCVYDGALVGDIEIENFPTLAVFRGERPLFYSVTMPQEGVVARTLPSLTREDRDAVAVPGELVGLPATLTARAARETS